MADELEDEGGIQIFARVPKGAPVVDASQLPQNRASSGSGGPARKRIKRRVPPGTVFLGKVVATGGEGGSDSSDEELEQMAKDMAVDYGTILRNAPPLQEEYKGSRVQRLKNMPEDLRASNTIVQVGSESHDDASKGAHERSGKTSGSVASNGKKRKLGKKERLKAKLVEAG